MSKAAKYISRVKCAVNATARKQTEDHENSMRLKAIREKAQAHYEANHDAELERLVGMGLVVVHGENLVVDTYEFARVFADTSGLVSVDEDVEMTQAEFSKLLNAHRREAEREDVFDKYNVPSNKPKTMEHTMELIDPETAERFMATGTVPVELKEEVEEVNGDDAAALLYFSNRNTNRV